MNSDSALPTAPDDAAPERLAPRPLYRPTVDPASAAAFSRPAGVADPFAPGAGRGPSEPDPALSVRPPDPVLAEAFGRPEGETDTIGRDPDAAAAEEPGAETVADPWRDPAAPVRLGAAAVQAPPAAALPPAAKLGVRDVLFGQRIAPRAVAVLVGAALAVGLVGGIVGRITAENVGALTSKKVELTQSGGGDREVGQVAKVAQAVLPSVVSIQVALGDQTGTGSGVVIDGAGYIVTNNHVVSLAATDPAKSTLRAVFSDGTHAPARIVGRDTKTDLAVVKVDVGNLTVAQLGKSADLQVGEDVVAVGSPLGLSKTVTSGIVSALHRPVRLSGEGTDTDAVIDAVQTDAAINPGNSGGPLVDDQGRVIGINSAIRSESGGSVGLGFAIPVDDVTRVAQELIRTGAMHHSEIGVNARSVTNDQTTGAQVANVQAGGPAQQAGIVEGDVIVKVGDRTVANADELVVAVHQQSVGQSVPVQLIRSGREVEVQVTPVSD
ncbi:PDZ domain-containing protein [Rhodococcus spelaei]|uniref:PDZ domain-containing protein n=1 Tax=Rhodococcus spelaei TaxID=2546320 RepID=A0A541AZP4_9NOCA|nr:trypsin-like peptidase domain-containing protein [Rhodococcus spelaei]TQF65539.1 PDZ domain-containing protein [Rhodococcus spelaei]